MSGPIVAAVTSAIQMAEILDRPEYANRWTNGLHLSNAQYCAVRYEMRYDHDDIDQIVMKGCNDPDPFIAAMYREGR